MSTNRKNCPSCGRANSVKIRNDNGIQSEHCFGVDCNYFVKERSELDMANGGKTFKRALSKELLLEARTHPDSLEFMQKYFCSNANANIYFYPKDNRVVFNYKDLYVGRALDKSVQPKWYVYSDIEHPFVVQKYKAKKSREVILVEDCVSACNASRIMDSIALLGTSLNEKYLTEVFKYDMIYIALDEDATSKAIKMYEILSLVKGCRVIPLKKDIKYMSMGELERLIT